MILSWVLSVFVAILAIVLFLSAVFFLAVGFDELCKFRPIRFIVRIILPLLISALVIGAVGGVAIFIHRAWVQYHIQVALATYYTQDKPLAPPPIAHDDRNGTDPLPVKIVAIEHMIDGPGDNPDSHKWFELDEKGEWHTIDVSNHPEITDRSFVSVGQGEFIIPVTYVRGGDGHAYMSGPIPTPTEYEPANAEHMRPFFRSPSY